MLRIAVLILTVLSLSFASFAQEEVAQVRIAHLSADAGPVDVYVNFDDELILEETFEFSDITSWLELEPGTYSVVIVPEDGEIEEAVLEAELEVADGDWLTVVALGEAEKETLAVQVLAEDYSALDSFQSRLSVFHAVPNYDPVNVLVNDVELIRFLGYPGFWGPDSDGFISFDLLAQTSDIVLEQDDGTVAVELEDVVLGGNRHYFLAIAGVAGDPQFIFVGEDLETAEMESEDEDRKSVV